jgi:hypothetical protein
VNAWTILAVAVGLTLPWLVFLAVWRVLLWATARAERDIYFNREYARPPKVKK